MQERILTTDHTPVLRARLTVRRVDVCSIKLAIRDTKHQTCSLGNRRQFEKQTNVNVWIHHNTHHPNVKKESSTLNETTHNN